MTAFLFRAIELYHMQVWGASNFGAADAVALYEAKDAHVRHTGVSGLFAGKDASLGISDVYQTGAYQEKLHST